PSAAPQRAPHSYPTRRSSELGLAVTRPDDGLAGVMDRVRKRHSLVEADAGKHVGERRSDTFEGVAAALAHVLPGVGFDQGMTLANTIHNTGQAVVWSGHREPELGRASCRVRVWSSLWSSGW